MKPEKQSLLAFVALGAALLMAGRSPAASADEPRDQKIREAAEQCSRAAMAFDAIMQVPDKAIPRDLLSRAKAVAVFHRVIKAASAEREPVRRT